MKIVALSGFAWEPKGTARARAFPLMSALAKRGHQVTLLTVPYDNPKLSGTECVRDGIPIKGIALKARTFRCIELPPRAAGEIENGQPDIVHVFKPKGYAGAIASILLRRRRVPVCIDCDDWEGWGGWNEVKPYPYLVKEYIDFQEKRLIRGADSLTVASRVLLTRALAIGQAELRTFYAPNCVTQTQLDLLSNISRAEPLSFKQKLGLTKAPIILYAGHFEPADDVLFFCRSVVPALMAGATLVLIGDGPEMPKVHKFFAAYPDVTVRYFGRLSYEDYLQVVGASDITCFPYPDTPVYRAKCSARIIDYMACGKPVVTTKVGQNSEYIVDGESGILVNPNRIDDCSLALVRLLDDASLRHRLGVSARERISGHFVWDGKPVEECELAYATALRTRRVTARDSLALRQVNAKHLTANEQIGRRS